MFRKTFICVAGVIAGVSAGAYSSGFFNEDNIVTMTYEKTLDRMGFGAQGDDSFASGMNADPRGDDSFASGMNAEPRGGSLVSTGLAASGADSSIPDDTDSIFDSREPENEALAANTTSRSSIKRLDMRDVLDSADGSDEAAMNIAALAKEAEAAAKEATLKKAELERLQAELVAQKAMAKRRLAEARQKQAQQARIKAEKARIQAELKEAQALVEKRFSKEVYESSTGEKLNYRKLVPNTSQKNKLHPLVIFLHGKGERGDDNQSQLKHGLKLFAADEGMKRFPAIVIAPQCPTEQFWSTTLEQKDTTPKMSLQPTPSMRLVIELLDSIQLTDSIDPDRIYVTGLSMGGFGTFDLLARRPNLFAAAAPLCGGGDPSPTKVKRLLRTPMWVVHGTDDDEVNINRSREMVYALEAAGGTPRYSELAGFGHNIWDATYGDIELYNWMFSQSKAGVIKRGTKRSQVRNANATRRKGGATARRDSMAASRVKPTVATKMAVGPQPATKPERSAMVDQPVKPLLGQWKVLAASQKGQQAAKKALEKMSVTFEKDQFVIQMGGRQEIAKFKLSNTNKTRQIDIISSRKGVEDSAGIYELRGDQLIICWGEPGRPRPTRFVNLRNVKSLVLKKQ